MDIQTIAALTTLYNEPQRHYHNLSHIQYCLAQYEEYCIDTKTKENQIVINAIWWHDAVYNPYSKNNEKNRIIIKLR